jgi:hypothetical protein
VRQHAAFFITATCQSLYDRKQLSMPLICIIDDLQKLDRTSLQSSCLQVTCASAVSHLRIFGTRVYVHVPKQKRDKLSPRASHCILLDWDEHTKRYRCYSTDSKQILISRDVRIDETYIPATHLRPVETPLSFFHQWKISGYLEVSQSQQDAPNDTTNSTPTPPLPTEIPTNTPIGSPPSLDGTFPASPSYQPATTTSPTSSPAPQTYHRRVLQYTTSLPR